MRIAMVGLVVLAGCSPVVAAEDGSDGAPGEAGPEGADGADGRDGVDGRDGEAGPRGVPGQSYPLDLPLRYTVAASVNVADADSESVVAECEDGHVLIGGGCEAQRGKSFYASRPDGEAWLCSAMAGESPFVLAASATCAPLGY